MDFYITENDCEILSNFLEEQYEFSKRSFESYNDMKDIKIKIIKNKKFHNFLIFAYNFAKEPCNKIHDNRYNEPYYNSEFILWLDEDPIRFNKIVSLAIKNKVHLHERK